MANVGISGGSILKTEDNGTIVVAATQILNFIGATVSSTGPGEVTIDISGGTGANRNLSNLLAPVQPNLNIDMQSAQTLVNVPTPINPGDAVPKSYVDGFVFGWGLAGNAASPGDVLGTTNATPFVQIFNNVEAGKYDLNGFSLNTNEFNFLFGLGTLWFGHTAGGGVITASGNTCFAFGSVDTGASILAGFGQDCAMAFGKAIGAGSLQSLENGTLVFGYADTNGVILAQAKGAVAFGRSENNGTIRALAPDAHGSMAHGYADNAIIEVSAKGSHVSGCTDIGAVSLTGKGAILVGDGSSTDADYSATFGHGHNGTAFSSLYAGRYSSSTGSGTIWNDTEPLFVLGNGLNGGSRADAFKVDKDGKMETSGAQKHRAIRATSIATTLSARTDRTLIVDASAASYNITLPPGEDGLEFIVRSFGTFFIGFTPSGGDTIDPIGGINSPGFRHFQFLSGQWWAIEYSV